MIDVGALFQQAVAALRRGRDAPYRLPVPFGQCPVALLEREGDKP